jgi:hypothetical protein
MDNQAIAKRLMEHAAALEGRQTSLFRARAFRRAAEVMLRLERPLSEVYAAEGAAGLRALEGIGESIAYSVEALLTSGELKTLRPDDAHVEPDRLPTSLRGVGPKMALLLRERFDVHSIDDLEAAVRDGRLVRGGLRASQVRVLLDGLAERRERDARLPFAPGEPGVAELLAVDAEFRAHVERHRGAGGLAWLPPFRLERDSWRYRCRFARSVLALRAGKADDWVEITFAADGKEGQRVVVTEERGDLAGRRVVRGRERECRALPPETRPAG